MGFISFPGSFIGGVYQKHRVGKKPSWCGWRRFLRVLEASDPSNRSELVSVAPADPHQHGSQHLQKRVTPESEEALSMASCQYRAEIWFLHDWGWQTAQSVMWLKSQQISVGKIKSLFGEERTQFLSTFLFDKIFKPCSKSDHSLWDLN